MLRVAADKAAPPQGITFPLLIHRIHDGVNMVADGGSLYGRGLSAAVTTTFRARCSRRWAPNGQATDLANCSLCHVNGSEANLPVGLNNAVNPQGWINPEGATATACSGCHVAQDAAAHFLGQYVSARRELHRLPSTRRGVRCRPRYMRSTEAALVCADLVMAASGNGGSHHRLLPRRKQVGCATKTSLSLFARITRYLIDTHKNRAGDGRASDSCHGPGPETRRVRGMSVPSATQRS